MQLSTVSALNTRKLYQKYGYLLFLSLIILGGCFFYFSGANWGMPMALHKDEISIVMPAIRMVEANSFNPDVFSRPDHLLIKISSIIYGVFSSATGESITAIAENNIGALYFLSRLVTCCFQIGNIIVAFCIGRKRSAFAGLISAFLVAFFPVMTQYTFFATSDVATTFFMLLFILVSMRYLHAPSYPNLIILCLIIAAFICVKYTGAILLIFMVILVLTAAIRDKNYIRILKHALVTIACVLGFIFIISPVLFTNFEAVIGAFTKEARAEHLGVDVLGWGGNMLYYVETYFAGTGIVLTAFLAAGIFKLIKSEELRRYMFPICFGFIYWVVMSIVPLHWVRWGLPMFVSPLLISAIGIDFAFMSIRKTKKNRRLASVILYVCLGIVGVNFLSGCFATYFQYSITDTRVASNEHCKENRINRKNSIYEVYTPLQTNRSKKIFDDFELIDGEYRVKDEKKKYVVLSSDYFYRYIENPQGYPVENAIYSTVRDSFRLLKQYYGVSKNEAHPVEVLNIYRNIEYMIRANEWGLTGPEILIYRVPKKK